MCGIVGIISRKAMHFDGCMLRAQDAQKHRGPDGNGIAHYKVLGKCISLGHQRLAILDLTEAGRQPMTNSEQKGVIVFNGEVYNYLEIREELKRMGYKFYTNCDTEVVLRALHHWGPAEGLSRFNGMWAIAWMDLEQQKIILSRDRAGKKPLYYCYDQDQFYFASEIKTLLVMIEKKFELNLQIVGEYLEQSLSDTSTETFFRGIRKIPAGHYGVIDLIEDSLDLHLKQFWTVPTSPKPFEPKKDISELRELFIDAVRLRLRSDVPVGILLSGGIDSSSIAAVMQRILGKEAELNLLSAISESPLYDESSFIDRVASHLRLSVQKVILDFDPGKIFEYLNEVSWVNDEPIGSLSNVAHYLLMRHARELGITVILSGQGADELLCGYRKYLAFYSQYLLREFKLLKAVKLIHDFYHEGTILNQISIREAKRYMPDLLKPPELEIRGTALKDFVGIPIGIGRAMTVQQRQALDLERFSVPVLTHYEDRMSMAWSREIRLPFLDYRIMEMLIPLSIDSKLSHGWTKYIFRKSMEPFLPHEIVWRKDKQGFINPQSEWLKKELYKNVREHFSTESLIYKHKLINIDNLKKKYELYCHQPDQKGNIWFKDIFNSLALEIWMRRFSSYIL